MSEPTGTDANDAEQAALALSLAGLTDELGSRQLNYKRALERHMELVRTELAMIAATRDPSAFPEAHDPLPRSWQQVREARALRDAAVHALNVRRTMP